MSNPTKTYNDYVRANLPSTMTFDSTTVRYDINIIPSSSSRSLIGILNI